METMFRFDALPQLATGNNEAGSGQACIMNAISYLTGQQKINDLPDCVWEPLARMAQVLNDSICRPDHLGWRLGKQGFSGHHTALLCPDCTHKMWIFGARLIGSAETAHGIDISEAAKVMILAATSEIKSQGWKSDGLLAVESFLNGDPIMTIERLSRFKVPVDAAYTSMGNEFCRFITHFVDFLTDSGTAAREASLSSCLGQMIMMPVSKQIRFGIAHKMVDAFSELTCHVPVPPLPEDIEAARIRAGLVSV